MDDTEVKGLWFASTRSYLRRVGGDDLLETLAVQMPKHADALREPVVGAWYPEAALHELLEALWQTSGRDREVFVDHCTKATHEGVGKFFKILISLGSPGFVLRKVPVMWGRLRRGDRCEIVVTPGQGESVVAYRRFPWFRHEVYHLMTEGSLRGLVEMSTGKLPRTEVLESGIEHVVVRVTHPQA